MKAIEGYMPFKGYKTYYRIIGENSNGHKPILLLHGGPGSTHNYFEVLDRLSEEGRQVISYDQIGCGNSFVEGHPELWNEKTWLEELINIREYLHLDEVHILGQSWGGMLLIEYLIEKKPQGVSSAILASTLPDSKLWGREQHRMIKFMSVDDKKYIAAAEASEDYSDENYLKANERYMELHCAGAVTEDSPECLRRPKKSGAESYLIGWGPNEYTPLGTLKDFNYTERLCEINVPCLITSGTNDLCTPLIAKTMYDRIPDAQWELFDGTRHMSFVEQNDKYCEVLSKWMREREKE
ncbi:MAG: proline iminopeptidase-family hydrolase [Muribaculaceae bacterium]|jgi:proline iminopeptidase|nr:proline iminopeptidase-family hydrolase [Muribaculaceae bacterium]